MIVASTTPGGRRRARQRWEVHIGATDRSGAGAWSTLPFMDDCAAVNRALSVARRFDGSHDSVLLVNRDSGERWWIEAGRDGRELIRRPA